MSKSTAVTKASDASIPVDPEQTLKACKALVAHIKKAAAEPRNDGKQNLLADEESTVAETPVWLTLTTKKHIHDSHRLQPGKIVLPNPLNTSEELSVCLITADPQRWYKNAVADEFPEDLRAKIGRVIDISHLRAKFKAYEAQRKLFGEHDVFLADDRIINRLPKALGKSFYKTTTKRPVPVVLMAQRQKVDGKRVAAPKGKKQKRDPVENVNARPIPEIVTEVQKAIGAALVHLSPSTNTAVKVGYASWEPETIAANVEAARARSLNDLCRRNGRTCATSTSRAPRRLLCPSTRRMSCGWTTPRSSPKDNNPPARFRARVKRPLARSPTLAGSASRLMRSPSQQ